MRARSLTLSLRGVGERAWDSVGAGMRLSALAPSGDGLFHDP